MFTFEQGSREASEKALILSDSLGKPSKYMP
jgi:hypothetical protein